jgi:hypothetical protein
MGFYTSKCEKKPKQLHLIGYPASEHVSEAQGLHDPVYPGKTDPVIRVKKIQAEKKTRTLMAVEELHRGEDGNIDVKY